MSQPPKIFDRELLRLNYLKSIKNNLETNRIIKFSSELLMENISFFTTEKNPYVFIYNPFCYNFSKTTQHENLGTFDEEHNTLTPNSQDIIISNLSLHYANDIIGALIQYKKCLKEKGIFTAAIFGGVTLKELREVLKNTEIHNFNGISPRIIPMISLQDATSIMQRAGFHSPVIDSQSITVHYSSLKELLDEAKLIGFSNVLNIRNKKYPGKEFFQLAEKEYFRLFRNDNKIIATYEIITLTGRKH
jgi:hypothetical protein